MHGYTVQPELKTATAQEKEGRPGAYDSVQASGLAAFLVEADIRLVRGDYLRQLLVAGGRLPRRQEAEQQTSATDLGHVASALVSHEEVRNWAAGDWAVVKAVDSQQITMIGIYDLWWLIFQKGFPFYGNLT